MLTLSPMIAAPVCRVGDELNLTCTASVEFISWSFMVVTEHGEEEEITIFSTSSLLSMPTVVNSTTFTLTRNSPQGVLPLIVTLSIDSVSIGLNGTVVNCVDTRNSTTSASTTIQIIDTGDDHYIPTLRVTSEEYSTENITVTLEWDQFAYAKYNAIVVPPVPIVFTGNTSCQLIIPYNAEYNFSIEVAVPCRANSTTLKRLNYANCGHPDVLPNANESVPKIEDYDGLPIEGTTIRFSCPLGLELIGVPNSAICTENGEWEPDLYGLMCNSSDIDGPMILSSKSIVLISSLLSVGIVCILATVTLTAMIVYKKKGVAEKRLSLIGCRDGGRSSSKHSTSNKVVYQKKSSLWIENTDQRSKENLVYANVTIATKQNKNKAIIPNEPSLQLATTTQPDLTVEYSAINFKSSNEKPVNMEGSPNQYYDNSFDVTLDKLLDLLREEVGPRWYDFGEAVGIDSVVLDSIAKTTFPENCIVEVLDYWLKYFDDGTLSWSDVATALRDINLLELAYHIEQEYSVEADTSDLLQDTASSAVMPSFL